MYGMKTAFLCLLICISLILYADGVIQIFSAIISNTDIENPIIIGDMTESLAVRCDNTRKCGSREGWSNFPINKKLTVVYNCVNDIYSNEVRVFMSKQVEITHRTIDHHPIFCERNNNLVLRPNNVLLGKIRQYKF